MIFSFKSRSFTLSAAFLSAFCVISSGALGQSDWFNLDFETDSVRGVSVNKALKFLDDHEIQLAPVVVAVIDDGVDIEHPDFEGRIFINVDEKEDGTDSDGNTFVDDIHGWNFLGNSEGENIEFETLEITRLVRRDLERFEGKAESDFRGKEKKEFRAYMALKEEYDASVKEAEESFSEFSQFAAMYAGAMSHAQELLGRKELTAEMLLAHDPTDEGERQVIDFLLMAERENLRGHLEEGSEYFDMVLNYHYNMDYKPRDILDDTAPGYGNPMVWAANPDHGTHVAGIIAAVRGNDIGIDGVAPNAVILPIRAVPGGDERDNDVAAAIRYATDMGAKVINMSFGKPYSPEEASVREAVRYAADNDVLLVHAAGNDATNNDQVPNYPDGTFGKRKPLKNWITVAASGPADGPELLAEFSNFGKKKVDILAPGVDIRSLKPEGKTAVNSGTSMAAPVVSGVAALIRGMNPELSAEEVKKILMRTAQPLPKMIVSAGEEELPLKKAVRTPGVVSAADAVKYTAEKYGK